MNHNVNTFHDELYREHAAALEAFIEARRAWQAFFEGPGGLGKAPDESQLYTAAQKMVGSELKQVEQERVFHEALDRAKRYLDEFQAFSISCTRMKENLDRTLARSAATGDTSKATRRLSRKLVEEEGGP